MSMHACDEHLDYRMTVRWQRRSRYWAHTSIACGAFQANIADLQAKEILGGPPTAGNTVLYLEYWWLLWTALCRSDGHHGDRIRRMAGVDETDDPTRWLTGYIQFDAAPFCQHLLYSIEGMPSGVIDGVGNHK